ncbi:MAG: membrane protein insertion efficiency factor YidD [Candidatus Omnitrophota bacterium]
MMKTICAGILKIYQRFLSPLLPRSCRFWPSCSEYSIQAINKYGCIRGIFKSLKRILRCHPLSSGGYDPV